MTPTPDPRAPTPPTPPSPLSYTVEVSADVAARCRDWTPIASLPVDWVKVVTHEDGTAVVYGATGTEPPRTP